MGAFRWIGAAAGALWRFSRRSWIDTGMGLRPRSGASALVLFLFLIFFIVGLALVLLGFDLGDADRWIEAQGGWLDAADTWLFRAVSGLVLLICVFMVLGALFDRRNPERPGLGCAAGAVLAGYFAWFGMTG